MGIDSWMRGSIAPINVVVLAPHATANSRVSRAQQQLMRSVRAPATTREAEEYNSFVAQALGVVDRQHGGLKEVAHEVDALVGELLQQRSNQQRDRVRR